MSRVIRVVLAFILSLAVLASQGASPAFAVIRWVDGSFVDTEGRPVIGFEASVTSGVGLETQVKSDSHGNWKALMQPGALRINSGPGNLELTYRTSIDSSVNKVTVVFPKIKTMKIKVTNSATDAVRGVNITHYGHPDAFAPIVQDTGNTAYFNGSSYRIFSMTDFNGEAIYEVFDMTGINATSPCGMWTSGCDIDNNGVRDGVGVTYKPFSNVTLTIAIPASDWMDGLAEVELPDVPTIEVVAPVSVVKNSKKSILAQVKEPSAAGALSHPGNLLLPTISSYKNIKFYLYGRTFSKKGVPSKWKLLSTSKVSKNGKLKFAIKLRSETQFKIVSNNVSTSSKSFEIRIRKRR